MKKWSVLVVLCMAITVIVIDTTIMNVSIGALVDEFGVEVTDIQAAITLYTLVMAALMITGGKLNDILGQKPTFVAGLVLYGIGSFMTAVSPSYGVLVLGWSVIEGIGGAILIPSLQVLIRENYEGQARAIAYGVFGSVMAVAAALGPIVGGFLTTYYTWRYAFFAEVAIVVIVLIASPLVKTAPKPAVRPKLDYLGILLNALGLGTIVFATLQISKWGLWQPMPGSEVTLFGISPVPFLLALGVLIMGVFVWWQRLRERKQQEPLVSISLFKNVDFTAGLSVAGSQTLIQMGIFFVVPVFLQTTLQLTAMDTGWTLLPISAALAVMSIVGVRLTKRMFPKHVIQLGLMALVLGTLISAIAVRPGMSASDFVWGFLVLGAGMGLIVSQMVNVVLSTVKPDDTAEASGVLGTSQQVGGSLGTALIGTVLTVAFLISMQNLIETSTAIQTEVKDALVLVFEEGAAHMENAEEIAARITGVELLEIGRIASVANFQSMRAALLAVGLIALLALAASLKLPKRRLVAQDELPGMDVPEMVMP